MIIDIHTHLPPGAGLAEARRLADVSRQNGVDLVFLCCLGTWEQYPPPEVVRAANTQARDSAALYPDIIRWLAYLNPQNPDWRGELERCLAEGASGIKLWLAQKDADGGLQNTTEVLACAEERGLPVLMHTYIRTDDNSPGEITTAQFAALAREVPECRLVGAHAGGNWRRAVETLQDAPPNACVDVSGSYPERGMVEALVDTLGADRVIFGSDALGRTIPSQLAKVTLADISDADKEQILWKNAARVFSVGLSRERGNGKVARGLRTRAERPIGPFSSALSPGANDHFCYCGTSPYFDTRPCTPSELDALLAKHRIDTAYVGDLGSIHARNLQTANNTFLASCTGLARVTPLATLNPAGDDWRQALDTAAGRFAGAVIHPYLHAWKLDDGAHGEFFRACSERKLPLWINCALSDHRFRHPDLPCRPVAVEEVCAFAPGALPNQYVFQGATLEMIKTVLDAGKGQGTRFFFEVSRLTDFRSWLTDILDTHGPENLVMGAEFPFRDLREVRYTAERLV